MYKYILMTVLLAGCGVSDDSTDYPKTYLVTGQSNAGKCDWGYYERISGNYVIKMAYGRHSIDDLINRYDPTILENADIEGIFLVHGERDSLLGTDPTYYADRLRFYHSMINETVGYAPMYISTVGNREHVPVVNSQSIRDAVKGQEWIIAWDKAQHYKEWGMLEDGTHFNKAGCRLMMEAFNEAAE